MKLTICRDVHGVYTKEPIFNTDYDEDKLLNKLLQPLCPPPEIGEELEVDLMLVTPRRKEEK